MDKNPPVGLAGAGRRLWLACWNHAEIPERLRETLLLGCKQADRAAECREILGKSGLEVRDRFGQIKVHPLVAVERAASVACAALIRSVVGNLSGEIVEAMTEEDLFA